MDKTNKSLIKSVGVRAIIVVGDILLGGFLSWETWVLVQKYNSIKEALAGDLLSDNVADFIAKLESQLPSTSIWIVVVGGLAITLALILGIFLTKDRLNQLMTRINAVWLLAWAIFGIYWVFVLISLLSSFREMFG
jgi:hypothetical protein